MAAPEEAWARATPQLSIVPVKGPGVINPKNFVEALAKQIADALRHRAREFKMHRLGAVALDAHPWHKGMSLSVLIETDTLRKWDMGDWEHQEFAILGKSPLIEQGYEDLRDDNAKGSRIYRPFFRCCALALCHNEVTEALKEYALEPDFELFVGDPDDPNDVNFCEEILGVDERKRKKKTEIVDDLEEALKDPESVRVLKYWYQDELTRSAEEKIARLTNLEVLYLSSMGLKELPTCVPMLQRLTELHLDWNHITRLTGLHSLPNLRLLSLRSNGVITSEMTQAISQISSLRQLWVGHCDLIAVPQSWQQLKLEELYLFGNPLTSIPDWLPALSSLKRLGLVEAADDETKARLRERHPHLEIW
jgi:hypothetical protein